MSLRTVTAAIASLTVPGLVILDTDGVPANAADAGLPVLFPEPVDFVTNVIATRRSFGLNDEAAWDLVYDLTYTLCYASAGAGATPFTDFRPAIEMAMAVVQAAITTEIDGVLLEFSAAITTGPVPDPNGNMYLGSRLTFHVTELLT